MSDPRDAFDLTGRVAVVTGAGSGIGAETARVLAAAGAAVTCADRNGPAAEATARAITATGATGAAAVVDVAQHTEVDELLERVAAEQGRVDVMANVAGIIDHQLVVDTSEADLDQILAVNLKGVFFGCQAAARRMVTQGSGSIINLSSAAIDAPAAMLAGYAMTKAAVAQLTKTLAVEVGPAGVRVNALAPGFILTPMVGRHFTEPDGTIDEERKELTVAPIRDATPLRRIGAPEDVALAILYLASDASSFMTGQILRPNGGVAMP
jgi:3-oxoacyl-[acyl-carrier protein] reductase